MSIACALAFLLAATPSAAPAPDRDTPAFCDDERASCRGGCSVDYGSSMNTRGQLTTCLDGCDERHELCRLRVMAKQRERRARPPDAGTNNSPGTPLPAAPYTLPVQRQSADGGMPEGEVPSPAPLTEPETKAAGGAKAGADAKANTDTKAGKKKKSKRKGKESAPVKPSG